MDGNHHCRQITRVESSGAVVLAAAAVIIVAALSSRVRTRSPSPDVLLFADSRYDSRKPISCYDAYSPLAASAEGTAKCWLRICATRARPVAGVCTFRGSPDADTLEAPRTCDGGGPLTEPTRLDFENLLAFRVALRRFQRWSEDQAGAVGLTHVQHQLLVAIKGHPGSVPPSVGQIADYLLLQSHSAVGLVDRAEAAGFVRRGPDPDDARVARVALTEVGDRLVTELTAATLAEMRKLADALNGLLSAGQETG